MFWILVLFLASAGALDVPYTEDINQFKDKYYNARTQYLVGCWLYVSDYLQENNLGELNESNLHILKACMKKINRKNAVLKITSLAEKNVEPVPPFDEIVDVKNLPRPNSTLSEFDKYLLDSISNYQTDFKKIKAKGQIKDQVEEQLNRRKVYYFGVIPADAISHTTFLVTISITVICLCTWWKYYKMDSQRREEKKLKIKEKREKEMEKLEERKKIKAKFKKNLND